MSGSTSWEILIREFRYAARNLRKSPGFAATAFLTLALGIGASTAVFTIIDSVLLRPLSYRDSARLVAVWERVRFLSGEPAGPNPKHVDIWQKRATAFSGLGFLRQMAMGLTTGGEHPRLTGTVVCSSDLFNILQVQPALGRTFVPGDGIPGHDNVVILTDALWQSLFHGERDAIGKIIRLGDVPREVIGVLPAGFRFPSGTALHPFRRAQTVSGLPEPAAFLPAALDMAHFSWDGNYGNWICLGRLKRGTTAAQAEAELNTIQAQLLREMPANRDRSPGSLLASLQPMQEAMVGDFRRRLWLLMFAVIGLMLLACLNLANAQLGRALARSREAAVRTALGAGRWQLIWNSLAENLLLAGGGGAAGVLVAAAGLALFRRYSPIDVPRLSEVQLNSTVLLFSMALISAASVLCGILPALRLISADPQISLQQGNSRAVGSRQSNRVRRWLVGLQVCGCTALLLVTGLFSKSLLYLLRQDKGFETGRVMAAEVRLTPQTYGKDQSRIAFDDAVLENLRAIPGVQASALMSAMPLDGESWIEAVQRIDRPNLETPLINFRWVSPGYFELTRQRLVAGRFLEARDRELSSAILSESEAKALWGSENPIGGQVSIEGRKFTVVGVVADSRNTSLKLPPARMAYVHYKDRPPFPTYFLIRAAQSPEGLAAAMRQAIWKFDPEVTIARVKTLDAQLADSLATERFQTLVLVAFGTAAMLMAMLGIYGVLSYSVAVRKQEIGLRMALGANRRSVYALMVGEAAIPVFAGMAAGLAASILAGRVIGNLLYGVQVLDAGVILMVTGLFLSSAVAAAYVPARRAASVDPMEALRSE